MQKTYNKQYKTPCLDCKDRVPGCHGSCPAYLEFRKMMDTRIDERQKTAMLSDAKWRALDRYKENS